MPSEMLSCTYVDVRTHTFSLTDTHAQNQTVSQNQIKNWTSRDLRGEKVKAPRELYYGLGEDKMHT